MNPQGEKLEGFEGDFVEGDGARDYAAAKNKNLPQSRGVFEQSKD